MDQIQLVAVCFFAWAIIGAFLWRQYTKGPYIMRNNWEFIFFIMCGFICWVGFFASCLKRFKKVRRQ